MRNLIILILVVIALAVVRWLISDVVRAVKRSLGGPSGFKAGRQGSGQAGSETQGGHLVRDPVSGTYIDQRMAVKETIDGRTFYFESKENRDAYVKKARSG